MRNFIFILLICCVSTFGWTGRIDYSNCEIKIELQNNQAVVELLDKSDNSVVKRYNLRIGPRGGIYGYLPSSIEQKVKAEIKTQWKLQKQTSSGNTMTNAASGNTGTNTTSRNISDNTLSGNTNTSSGAVSPFRCEIINLHEDSFDLGVYDVNNNLTNMVEVRIKQNGDIKFFGVDSKSSLYKFLLQQKGEIREEMLKKYSEVTGFNFVKLYSNPVLTREDFKHIPYWDKITNVHSTTFSEIDILRNNDMYNFKIGSLSTLKLEGADEPIDAFYDWGTLKNMRVNVKKTSSGKIRVNVEGFGWKLLPSEVASHIVNEIITRVENGVWK